MKNKIIIITILLSLFVGFNSSKEKNITIDLSQCKVIDHTTLHSLRELQHNYEKEGGTTVVIDHKNHKSKGKDTSSTKVLKLTKVS